MKKLILFFALVIANPIFGFHGSIGFGWNSIDERFDSNLFTNQDKSGRDKYETHTNLLVPVIQLGHQFFLYEDWLGGISAEWKYINYKTPNVSSSRGQILPNATFSSINFFGPDVDRDFTSITRLKNELMLLASIGREIVYGYAYFGMGPVLFNGSNSIFVSSVHTPNGVGDHLVSTSVKDNRLIFGGAFRAGYQFYINQDYFLNLSYTYVQTGKFLFHNSINSANLNGFVTPGPINLFLKRTIEFSVQEFIVSLNRMF